MLARVVERVVCAGECSEKGRRGARICRGRADGRRLFGDAPTAARVCVCRIGASLTPVPWVVAHAVGIGSMGAWGRAGREESTRWRKNTRSKQNSARSPHPPTPAHHQGSDGTWRYTGGESFLDTLAPAGGYASLAWRLSEKAGGPVSIRYVLPGEPLDPDALITVADDDDVAELVREARRAARAGGGAGAPPVRVRVLLSPADDGGWPHGAASSGDASSDAAGSGGAPLTEEELADGASFFAEAEAAAAAARAAAAGAASGRATPAPSGRATPTVILSPRRPASGLAGSLAAVSLTGGGGGEGGPPCDPTAAAADQAAAAQAAVEEMHWEDGLRARLLRAASRPLWADDGVWSDNSAVAAAGGAPAAATADTPWSRAPTPPPGGGMVAPPPPPPAGWPASDDAWGAAGGDAAWWPAAGGVGGAPSAPVAIPGGSPAAATWGTAPGAIATVGARGSWDETLEPPSAAFAAAAAALPSSAGSTPTGGRGSMPRYGLVSPPAAVAASTPGDRASATATPGAPARTPAADRAAAAAAGLPSHISIFGGGGDDLDAALAAAAVGGGGGVGAPPATPPFGGGTPGPRPGAPRAPSRLRSHALPDVADLTSPAPHQAGRRNGGVEGTPQPRQAPPPPDVLAPAAAAAAHRVPLSDVVALRSVGEGAFGEVSLASVPTFGKVGETEKRGGGNQRGGRETRPVFSRTHSTPTHPPTTPPPTRSPSSGSNPPPPPLRPPLFGGRRRRWPVLTTRT